MTTSFHELSERFHETLTQFLWDQWTQIGVTGHPQSPQSVDFIIDPEALLLATTRFARHESRFLVEVLDWLVENGRSLVSQRIKNLQLNYRYGCVPVLMEFDQVLCKRSPRDWRSLKSLEESFKEKHLTPALPEEPDLRGMSRHPQPGYHETFIFTLRSLFGANARVEVMAWLLTHECGHPAEIARETGWYSKSVQQILNDLEASGMVFSEKHERAKRFRLEHKRWLRWLSPEVGEYLRPWLHWLNQGPLYLGCYHVSRILEELITKENASERLQAIVIREAMSEKIARQITSMNIAFDMAGFGNLFQGHRHKSGGELVELFYDGVENLTAGLYRDPHAPTSW